MFLNQSFELKSDHLTCTNIRIKEPDIAKFEHDFIKAASQAPRLFKNAAFVIIFLFEEYVTSAKLKKLKKIVESVDATLVGIKSDGQEQMTEAKKANINIVHDNKGTIKRQSKPEQKQIQVRQLMSHGKVRSGTQVYGKDKDVVICGDVSHGSEIIASGNIFIYGALYGKAIAGVDGDANAQIYCMEFAPELISIAGIYIVHEDFGEEFIGRSISARMENEKISLNVFKQKNVNLI